MTEDVSTSFDNNSSHYQELWCHTQSVI